MANSRNEKFKLVENKVGATYEEDVSTHSDLMPCINFDHESDDVNPQFSLNRITKRGVCFKCNKTWDVSELAELLGITTDSE